MSKYIDSFADAAVSSGNVVDAAVLAQEPVIKKKVKIDASLLQSLDVTTTLLLGLNASSNEPNGAGLQSTSATCRPTGGGDTCPTSVDKTCSPTNCANTCVDKTCS